MGVAEARCGRRESECSLVNMPSVAHRDVILTFHAMGDFTCGKNSRLRLKEMVVAIF